MLGKYLNIIMYAKIRNSEDDIMIDMSKSITFTDLRKRQNIRRNNECLHDKKYIRGYHKPLRIFFVIYMVKYMLLMLLDLLGCNLFRGERCDK